MKSHNEVLGLSFDGSSVVNSESDVSRRNEPGELAIVKAREGYRVYRYMKAEEAFAIGQLAMISAVLDDADVDEAATTSQKQLKGTGDFTAKEFANGTFPSAYVSIDVNTGIGQTRSIRDNSGDYLFTDRAWTVALDATSDYVTYDPNYVSLADTDDVSVRASAAAGVAISAIADENWGWFQVKGFCPLVRAVGSTDPAIRGAILVPSSGAGACKGPTAGGTTADEAGIAFGIAQHAYAAADSAGRGVAAVLDCRYYSL